MDDQLNQAVEELVTLSPDQKIKLEHRIARFQCAIHALRVCARRPYLSAEQATLIRGEADELADELAPLQAALHDGTLTAMLQATIEELG